MKFKNQLYFGNLIIVSLMIFVMSVLLWNARSLYEASSQVSEAYQISDLSKELMTYMVDMETGMRGFMLTGNEAFLEPYNSGRDAFAKTMSQIQFLVRDQPEQLSRLRKIEELSQTWRTDSGQYGIALKRQILKGELPKEALIHFLEGRAFDGTLLERGKRQYGKQIMDAIRLEADLFKEVELALLDERQKASASRLQHTNWTGFLGLAVVLVFGLLFTYLLNKRLLSRLGAEPLEVQAVANRLAEGDSSARVKLDNTGGVESLAISLNRMAENMEQTLKTLKDQNWMESGRSGLADSLRYMDDETLMAERALSFLCQHLNAAMGVCYLVPQGTEYLEMVASYAFTERKHLANRIKFGEGCAGQAARERKTILLTGLPDDYTSIRSGVGEGRPTNVLLVPFGLEDTLFGVVEIASFLSFSEHSISFLESVSESLAIAVQSSRDRSVTELLIKTQEQAEELQTQQEELRTTNEELELQTQSLLRSEELLNQQKTDILSKNKELEQTRLDLLEQAAELELAGKYKSEFLSNMSHEIRTPLNSMLILSKSLSENRQGNLTPDQVEDAKMFHEGGIELLNLINEILDLSKVEAGKMVLNLETVDLVALFKSMEKNYQAQAKEKGLVFETHIEEGVPTEVRSDRQRIQQILRNLLSNAFKFTREGSICLDLSVRPQTILGRLEKQDMIAIAVRDTGVGIPEEKRQQIFEAFQQADGSTSRTHGGTGLGLTISRKLAQLLGGKLQLDSQEDGAGSVFVLYLPMSIEGKDFNANWERQPQPPLAKALPRPIPEKGESPQDAAELIQEPADLDIQAHDISPEDRSLLIIEDDSRFLKVLSDFGAARDYKIMTAKLGRDGLVLAERYIPSAIILDLNLPDIDGRNVLLQLKYNLATRHIPVHIISGSEQEPSLLKQGALGFLQKPVRSEELEEVFITLEGHLNRDLREVLVIEDNKSSQVAIQKLIEHQGVLLTLVQTGAEALDELARKPFDCIILDLSLPDMYGLEVVNQLPDVVKGAVPPIIVYTGRELSTSEREQLTRCTSSVVLKGVGSPERLVDDLALFLHSVESSLPPGQREVLQAIHDPKNLLAGRTILVVDDDMRNIFALSKILTDMGINVESADNGMLAIEKLQADPDIDLILMDIMMPVMDGLETIRRIRGIPKFKDLPIISVTAKAMPEDKARCLEAGANDYLTKPVDVEQLKTLLRMWLHKVE